jgi:penicillin-binding protein 1A
VAIRLSIMIGENYWPPKKSYHLAKIAELGRSKIIATARAMGVTTPLPDTVSLPIGADDVHMIDMLGANAVFANGGKRATPFAALEIRNSHGEVIYGHEANAPQPEQIIPAEKIAEMNNMLTHVLTDGTGRAAQIPGIIAGGKTGTTNGSTNAWFNGFTGNLVCSVWFGNDDNSPMDNMTGGTLPAQSWREIMLYAHQGLDVKPPYGVAPGPAKAPETAAAEPTKGGAEAAPPRNAGLSPRAAQIITEIGDLARGDRSQSAEGIGPTSFAAQTGPVAGISSLSAGAVRP